MQKLIEDKQFGIVLLIINFFKSAKQIKSILIYFELFGSLFLENLKSFWLQAKHSNAIQPLSPIEIEVLIYFFIIILGNNNWRIKKKLNDHWGTNFQWRMVVFRSEQ